MPGIRVRSIVANRGLVSVDWEVGRICGITRLVGVTGEAILVFVSTPAAYLVGDESHEATANNSTTTTAETIATNGNASIRPVLIRLEGVPIRATS